MDARDFGLELYFVVDRDAKERLGLHRGRSGSHNRGAASYDTGRGRLEDHGRPCGCGGILSLAGLSDQPTRIWPELTRSPSPTSTSFT